MTPRKGLQKRWQLDTPWHPQGFLGYLVFVEGDFLRMVARNSSPFFTTMWAMIKHLVVEGCLGYIGGNTTQLYRDYNKAIIRVSSFNNQDSVESKFFFFRGSCGEHFWLTFSIRIQLRQIQVSNPFKHTKILETFMQEPLVALWVLSSLHFLSL